jgi:hypothetical protein
MCLLLCCRLISKMTLATANTHAMPATPVFSTCPYIALQASLHQMAAALRAALQGEQRWRERALVAEQKFEQLRGIVAARMLEGSWEAVQARQQHQWQQQAQGNEGAGAASGVGFTAAPAPAQPLRPNCRMRGGEAGAGQEV